MRTPIRDAQTVRDHLNPIAEEIDYDCRQCARVQRHVEDQAAVVPTEKLRNHDQMCAARDREEFRQSLHNRQDDRLIERHMIMSEIPLVVNFSLS